MLGLIKRTCKGLDDPKTLHTLYCSLVRSNLEYCSVVWSPYSKRNTDKLERVQNWKEYREVRPNLSQKEVKPHVTGEEKITG